MFTHGEGNMLGRVRCRKILTIGIVILFFGAIGMTILSGNVFALAVGNTIYVDDDNIVGPWDGTISNPYQYIQDGINAASNDDTVYVFEGTYDENIVVNKSVTLKGDAKPVIEGLGGTGIEITVNNVTVDGFKIMCSDHGIYTNASGFSTVGDIDIIDNLISNSNVGMNLTDLENATIRNNVIQNCSYGIYLQNSANNHIYHNNFINNTIQVKMSTFGNEKVGTPEIKINHVIRASRFLLTEDADTESITVYIHNHGSYTHPLTVGIYDSNFHLIAQKSITVLENYIGFITVPLEASLLGGQEYWLAMWSNVEGMHVAYDAGDTNQTSYKNMLYEFDLPDPLIPDGYENIVHTIYCTFNYSNTWDNGYPSGGNYWSDYNCTDIYKGPDQNITGSDLRGDAPYTINSNNIDHYPLTVPYETEPPTISVLSPENKTYAVNDVALTFTLDEAAFWMGYSLDGAANSTITGNSTLSSLSDGLHQVVVYANDSAGNMGASNMVYFIVDITPPIGSISIAEGATYTNSTSVTLTLFAEDVTSGVTQMCFSNDNATWALWEAYNVSKAWALTTGDETKTVFVQYMDNAGLTSSTYQDTIILDTTQPTANAGDDQTVNEDTFVTFDASASTDKNGIASYTWTFTDGTSQTLSGKNPTYKFATPGTYTVTLKVADLAGNTDFASVTITVLVDTDGDGSPDITDPDDDNDGVNDDEDAFSLDPAETVDTDGDGTGNNADTDDDNDGIPDVDDAFPLDASESVDTDGDGIGDNADTDDDNDEMPDSWEIENGLDPLDAADASLDPDDDGLTNLEEYQKDTNPNVSDAIAFPWWILGAAMAAVIGIAVAATLLWRKRK